MITIAKCKLLRPGLFMMAALSLCATAEAGVAGRFQFVAGDVRVLNTAGKERAAQKGQEINEGETVATASNGSAQLRMIDDGIVALRPDTRLKIDAYIYHGVEDGSENAVFSLLKGGLRAITGVIGKRNKERYSLQTPTGTIGIRGTDHEPMVVLPPPPGQTATIPPGTYDKVNVGATVLTTQAGTAVIAPNQVGFAGASNQAPVILPKVPDFYQASATQSKQDKKPDDKTDKPAKSNVTDSSVHPAEEKAVEADTLEAKPLSNLRLTAVDASGNAVDVTNTGTTETTVGANNVRGVAIADGWKDSKNSPLFDPSKVDISRIFKGSVDGGLVAPDRVVSGAGGLTEFLGTARGYTPVGAGTPTTDFSPVDATVKIGSATNQDLGSATFGSVTISWGRWEGGVIDVYSPDGSSKLGTIDNSNRSIHWLTTSAFNPSTALALPLTGTASYTLVGATTPTDLFGNKGTLNKITLDADFAQARINTTVDVSFNAPSDTSHWLMTADNIPLNNQKDGFQSDSSMNGTNGIVHTVDCTGTTCGKMSTGSIEAHLFSQGQGAIITYSMMTGKVSTTPTNPNPIYYPFSVISGLAVMKH